MTRLVAAILAVLFIIYSVPFVIYGSASALWGLPAPTTDTPADFMLGVLIAKAGVATAFVVLFGAHGEFWGERSMRYAAVWFVLFVFGEVGEAVSGRSSGVMAILGVVSEAIYLPLSALLTRRLLGKAAARPAGQR